MRMITAEEIENYSLTMDVINWCLEEEHNEERLKELLNTVDADHFLSKDVKLALEECIGSLIRMIEQS